MRCVKAYNSSRDLFVRRTEDTLRPTRWDCINAGQHLNARSRERVNRTCLERDEVWRYSWSDLGQVSINRNKGIEIYCYGSGDRKIFVEFVGVIMGIQVPLIIIDRRVVSVMSAEFSNRRVTHLRVWWTLSLIWISVLESVFYCMTIGELPERIRKVSKVVSMDSGVFRKVSESVSESSGSCFGKFWI